MNEIQEPYIVQNDGQSVFYDELQKNMLEVVQRLSGNVWTDYNPHDPGVTLGEAANYALTELQYKLGFPLEDYLTEENMPFTPERFGLHPASDVFATSIVTVDDYRKLLLEEVPEISNLQIDYNVSTNGYSISYVEMPFCKESEKIPEKIISIYNENRNLCEWLDKVEKASTEMLRFESEFEIQPGEDATTVLARVYWCILHYLADDPNSLSVRERTEYELYKQLYKVEGIKCFRTCYLKNNVDSKLQPDIIEEPQSRFKNNSTLLIPSQLEDLAKISIYCGKIKVDVDLDRFRDILKGFCLENRIKKNGNLVSKKALKGTWRPVFEHYSIINDMPNCYELSVHNANNSFSAYIGLYDWIIKKGLEEAKSLPRMLSILKKDEGVAHSHHTIRQKSKYLDFLDDMYGVESQPSWLKEENCYGESPVGILNRRMNFLRNIARLQKDRAKGRNLLKHESEGNAPTVKEWFCLLIGATPDDGHRVTNVLPRHNLYLLEKKDKRHDNFLRMDSLLINEKMMDPENVHEVGYVELAKDNDGKRKEYEKMRSALPFFNENLITGDLFRNGTNLKNYKILESIDFDYMLVYHHMEYDGWINLGHSKDFKYLERLANILRRFLRELNRECETIYLFEPVLADISRPYEVVIVLPSWTYRFSMARFRDESRKLLRSLVPAHIDGKMYWINDDQMRKFEFYYQQFLATFTDKKISAFRNEILKAMCEVLSYTDSKDIQSLNDSY